ncbi:methyl-accepting chemotaxis protein [Nisaea sp.]|uniref:methyl-accepting chemotaxis protein n=1 Tax=Nisaea sp. TaxID=2024842 RepID=UPI0032F05E3B
MHRFSIAQRVLLISVVALIGFIVIGSVILWGQSVRTTGAERQKAELSRLERAQAVSELFLLARRSEKDFLLRLDPKYIDRHAKISTEVKTILASLKGEVNETNAAILEGVEKTYDAYQAQFVEVSANWQQIGFDEKSGFRGALRGAVHEAETLIKENASDDLMVKLLMMRRHEKDFIIRQDPKYIGRLSDRIAEFTEILGTKSQIDAAIKTEIQAKLEAYKTRFGNLAEMTLTVGQQTKNLSALYAEASPLLEELHANISSQYAALTADVAATDEQALILTEIFIVIIGGAVFAIGLIVGRSISRPIGNLSAQMHRLAEGDKSIEVPVRGKDEIAEMARAVQVFKDNMIRNDEMQAESDARQERERKRASDVDALTSSFDGDVGELLNALSAAAATLQSTSAEMTETASDSGNRATAVASATEETTANVQTVATATTELSASIAEISSQVANATAVATDAARQADDTSTVIDELNEATGRIGEIVTLIREIAEQTNLLALNATIESARAGEAGKGFAVVASEVKNLAGQTGKATEDIAAQIGAIQERTSGAVDAIRSIVAKVGEMENITGSIAAAVEEQNAATQDISRNIEDVATAAQDVSQNVGFVGEASRNTSRMAGDVLGASSEMNEKSSSLGQRIKDFLQSVRAA